MGTTTVGTAVIAGSTPSTTATIDHRQMYCTVDEVFSDLDTPGGDIDAILRQIQIASQTILQEIGNFLPTYQARYLDGKGVDRLFTPPLLRLGSIVDDGDTLATTDYILRPLEKHWANGPYSWIEHDPDGDYAAWTDELLSVLINGWWGLYELTEASGLVVAGSGMTASAASMSASDGSKVSPGMLLRVGSEDIYVSGLGSATASVTTLSAAMDANQETIALTSGAAVNVGEILRVGTEKLKVLDISTNSGYVRRGYHKTKPAAHLINVAVDAYRTPTIVRGVNGSTAAEHTVGTAIYRLMVPADVNFLAREIATLAMKKAQSGYAGRTGNEQTGVTFYNDAFPRYDLERIKAHYTWTMMGER